MALTLTDSASEARTTLGTGTAAVLDVGTSENNVLQLNGSGALPALDGSNLTNLPASVPEFVHLTASSSSSHSAYSTFTFDGTVLNGTTSGETSWWNSSTGAVTVPSDGVYYACASAVYYPDTTFVLGLTLKIRKNNADTAAYAEGYNAGNAWFDNFGFVVSGTFSCSANDYFQVTGWSGIASGNIVTEPYSTRFFVIKVA